MTSEIVDAAKIEAEQIKSFRDFLFSYNKLSELCFVDCVWDFTSRTVRDQENNCAVNCAEKFLKANQRISQRFQEFQVISNENALAMAKKAA
uniref:Mitochondrial import inner membrane translocase subunit n=1 Tax=Daphnia similis TaxID=35528 RepID=A0A4Y7N2U2_9CRUS|nr:EOG090X0MSH [Daphnia similis]SVE87177.1 EOG090X0MSH [Daphnia similis]SVE87802.1 EOG090X0MSH [Daphnia similis]SVE88435.1 EOG090X0MSH [Daphnia similis]